MRTTVSIVLTAVLAALAGPAAVARAAAPALSAVKTSSSGHLGDVLAVTASVRNPARRRARVRIAFSLVPVGPGAVVAIGSVTSKPLKARATSRLSLRLRVPATAAAVRYVLRACIKKACRSSRTVSVLEGSADARIEADLAGGRLTPGKAALYQLYAESGDRRLPSIYRGTQPSGSAGGLIALEQWGSLSSAEQAAVTPYLLPPDEVGSHWAPGGASAAAARGALADPIRGCGPGTPVPAGTWFGAAAAGPVVVWASTTADAAQATSLASAIDAKIWPKLIGTDGFPQPLADTACDPTGDGRLDVYIVDRSVIGGNNAITQGSSCGPASAFILMARDNTDPPATLAHEFFHAEQAATGVMCSLPDGWVEGSALWARDEVYPMNTFVHSWNDWSHTSWATGLPDQSYNAWPFWYWLKRQSGAAAIRTLFTSLRAAGFDNAVHAAPAGGDFEAAYRDFALQFWNTSPIGESGFPVDSFSAWDSYPRVPTPFGETDLKLGGAGAGNPLVYTYSPSMKPYAIDYIHVVVSDTRVGQVTVQNGFEAAGGVGVEMLAQTKNGWKRIDLSLQPATSFCFSKPDEEFHNAIFVLSNAGKSAHKADLKLQVDPRCDPTVNFSGSMYSCTTACAGVQLVFTWSGHAQLQLVDNHGIPGPTRSYRLKSGSVDVTFHGTGLAGDCVGDGTGTVPLDPANGDSVEVDLVDTPPPTYYFDIGVIPGTIPVTYSGCADPPPPGDLPISVVSYGTSSGPMLRDPTASTIVGTYDSPPASDTHTIHYDWTINP